MPRSSSDQNIKMEISNHDEGEPLPWRSVSFACGGWLQFYMFGVAKALQESGLDYPSKVTYCGCSAGALAAVGLALEGDFDSAVTFCKEKCVPEVSRSFNFVDLRESINLILLSNAGARSCYGSFPFR